MKKQQQTSESLAQHGNPNPRWQFEIRMTESINLMEQQHDKMKNKTSSKHIQPRDEDERRGGGGGGGQRR